MADKPTAQYQVKIGATLLVCIALAVATVIGWQQYMIQLENYRTVANEADSYRQRLTELELQNTKLALEYNSTAISFAEAQVKLGDLESERKQLNQIKLALEADLTRARKEAEAALLAEQKSRQSLEQALLSEQQSRKATEVSLAAEQKARDAIEVDLSTERKARDAIAEDLSAERKARDAIEDDLSDERDARESIEDDLSTERKAREAVENELSTERVVLSQTKHELGELASSQKGFKQLLEQAQGKRQNLLGQIQQVNQDVAGKENELSSSLKDMAKLNRELADANQDRNRLESRIKELNAKQNEEAKQFAELKQKLETDLNESRVKITQLKNRMTVISVTSEVLFGSGSADIKPAGQKVLTLIASVLNTYPDRLVSIDGHTDNIPVKRGSFYKSNWQLSAARALAAAEILQQGNLVVPKRMRIVGHGQYRPIASNRSHKGRQLNRRIEIRLLPSEDKT